MANDPREIAASASRTTNQTFAAISNPRWVGVVLYFNVTTITGTTPTVTFSVQSIDPESGVASADIGATAAISVAGLTMLVIYPGIAAVANSRINDILPATWQVKATVGGTITALVYSIGASLME